MSVEPGLSAANEFPLSHRDSARYTAPCATRVWTSRADVCGADGSWTEWCNAFVPTGQRGRSCSAELAFFEDAPRRTHDPGGSRAPV